MFLGKSFKLLGQENFKGDNGVIAILGGSYMYTGAPIFSAKAAMKSGSDLVYIFTEKAAVSTIKSLHEAIVMPYEVSPRALGKITACLVGPGLGEVSEENLKIILQIIDYLNDRQVPIIVDGDAIHIYKQGHFANIKKLIITPNHNEAKGLKVSPTHICVYKNKVDIIEFNGSKDFVFNESSLKRCGGQGDILAGIIATSVSINPKDLINSCISACELTRLSAHIAFREKGYSLMTGDVLDAISAALEKVVE